MHHCCEDTRTNGQAALTDLAHVSYMFVVHTNAKQSRKILGNYLKLLMNYQQEIVGITFWRALYMNWRR